MSPKPLDDQSVKSQIEQSLKSIDAKTKITVEELNSRNTEGKTDTVEVRVVSDTEKALLSVGTSSDKPASRIESVYQADFTYEDKQWLLKNLTKTSDISVTPKEGANVSAILNPAGKSYVEGAPKERFWKTKLIEHKTDLEKGTDTVLFSKESKNAILAESGTVKYSYTFNKQTGKWDKVEESKLDDWVRTYSIAGRWSYKFTSKDGYYVTVYLDVSNVDQNGKISVQINSDAIRAGILSGLDVKNKWTAKVSQDNPFVFKSDETSYLLTIPDEGETNVLKLGDNIFRRAK